MNYLFLEKDAAQPIHRSKTQTNPLRNKTQFPSQIVSMTIVFFLSFDLLCRACIQYFTLLENKLSKSRRILRSILDVRFDTRSIYDYHCLKNIHVWSFFSKEDRRGSKKKFSQRDNNVRTVRTSAWRYACLRYIGRGHLSRTETTTTTTTRRRGQRRRRRRFIHNRKICAMPHLRSFRLSHVIFSFFFSSRSEENNLTATIFYEMFQSSFEFSPMDLAFPKAIVYRIVRYRHIR